ncbi:MAG: HNH endonuclease [Candidatus Tectomicrobia bacterium]
MHVDHIIPEAAGGLTVSENLCLACCRCATGVDSVGDALPILTADDTSRITHGEWHQHL